MFCPECKAEYRDGFTTCSDCQVPLVGYLPEELPEHTEPQTGPDQDLVEVAEIADATMLPVVRSLLEALGIPFVVQGEGMLSVLPTTSLYTRKAAVQGAKILVPRSRARDAKAILEAQVDFSDDEDESDDSVE